MKKLLYDILTYVTLSGILKIGIRKPHIFFLEVENEQLR